MRSSYEGARKCTLGGRGLTVRGGDSYSVDGLSKGNESIRYSASPTGDAIRGGYGRARDCTLNGQRKLTVRGRRSCCVHRLTQWATSRYATVFPQLKMPWEVAMEGLGGVH